MHLSLPKADRRNLSWSSILVNQIPGTDWCPFKVRWKGVPLFRNLQYVLERETYKFDNIIQKLIMRHKNFENVNHYI